MTGAMTERSPSTPKLTTESSLRQMYITGRIEVEEFEHAIETLLRVQDRGQPFAVPPADLGSTDAPGGYLT